MKNRSSDLLLIWVLVLTVFTCSSIVTSQSTTDPPTTGAETSPPSTAGESSPPTTAAGSSGPTTAAESSPPTTAAGSSGPTTAAGSSGPTTAAGSSGPTTAAGSSGPTTAAGSSGPTTAAGSSGPTTAAGSSGPTTAKTTTKPPTTPKVVPCKNKAFIHCPGAKKCLTPATDGDALYTFEACKTLCKGLGATEVYVPNPADLERDTLAILMKCQILTERNRRDVWLGVTCCKDCSCNKVNPANTKPGAPYVSDIKCRQCRECNMNKVPLAERNPVYLTYNTTANNAVNYHLADETKRKRCICSSPS